ncbi:MAG TPA: hypothetical protein H9899_07295 [Candidatus Sphingomonas excrementigallinarum]|nr:hypothetical protein [Candidatus Sphingomonas excrementigallinarum]
MARDRIYYRVESGPAFDFIKDWRERKNAAGKRLLEWAEKHGAIGFVPGWGKRVHGGQAINSLIFEGTPDSKLWVRRKNLTSDGKVAWTPRLRSENGKTIAAEMKEMEGLPVDDEFCDRFGFPHSLSYETESGAGSMLTAAYSITTAHIGWSSETVFWVALPDIEAIRAEYAARGETVTTPAWEVPEGMIPLTRAHYDLAFAQAEVDRLEKKAA